METDRPFTGWVSRLAVEHTRLLAGVARREGLSTTDAIDAVQEAFHTFLLLPQARHLVDDPDDSAKLLAVLVRNIARNLRRRHHQARPHVDITELPIEDDTASADELLARAEDHVRLLGCVTRLSAIQRNVVTLRMLDEVSGEEVASSLGLTAGHVAVLVHRAKQALRRCMED